MKKMDCPIGFIGCGNMAQAIIGALFDNGYTNLTVSDTKAEQLETVAKIAKTTTDNQETVTASKYIFLCVKPQNAVTTLNGLDFSDKIPVSIMAGIPLKKILEHTNAGQAVRVMPNLNACVRLSYNAYAQVNLSKADKTEVHALLSVFGAAAETDESMLDAVTGIAGSGPAYVFRFFKGLLKEAEQNGFSPAAAIEMCGMMIAGSVGNVLHSVFKDTPESFSEAFEKLDAKTDSVCSPGGTTIEGIRYLDDRRFTETVKEAAARAVARAKELSK